MKLITRTIALGLVAALFSCGGQKSDQPTAMLVVYATGDAKVITAAGTKPAKAGMLVTANDRIVTGSGTADLQTRAGSAVRLRSNTSITINELSGKDGKTNRLALKRGSVFANAGKQGRRENFQVVTPTAIAGVRGTSFAVTLDGSGRKPTVRVLNGKVAMASRSGKKQGKEVVLEEKTQGSLVGSGKPSTAKFSPTAEEKLDAATLVAVTPAQFDDVAAGKGQEHLSALDRERDNRRGAALAALKNRISARGLAGTGAGGYTSRPVTITMKDGTTYRGAVIGRSRASLIVHSAKSGIIELKRSLIRSVR